MSVRILEGTSSNGPRGTTLIDVDQECFAQGGMRDAYIIKEHQTQQKMVIKLYRDERGNTKETVLKDIVMQKQCQKYADSFNKTAAPKKVGVTESKSLWYMSVANGITV